MIYILKRIKRNIDNSIHFVITSKLTPLIMCQLILLFLFILSVMFSFSDCKDWRGNTIKIDLNHQCVIKETTRYSGYIASPNFPHDKYPPNSFCQHRIVVPENLIIKFKFVALQMEGEPIQKKSDCGSDFVQIEETINKTLTLVGGQRFCGYDTVFNPVYSVGNHVTVVFGSDEKDEYDGFVLTWKAVPKPSPTFNCTFERSEDLCPGWQQMDNDNADWSILHGVTWSSRYNHVTGPMYDHTLNNTYGTYAYFEATGVKEDGNALLLSPSVGANDQVNRCVRFWYHMFGEGMGKLFVREVLMREDEEDVTSGRILFGRGGNNGDGWVQGSFNVERSPLNKKFIFEAVRGIDYRSDIAIDDITITDGWCE